jgi:hypothetical protein
MPTFSGRDWLSSERCNVTAVQGSEIQQILAAHAGRYILRETAFPHGKLKGEYISVREPDGGFITGPLPFVTLDRLLRDGVVRLDGPYNQQDNLIYRPVALNKVHWYALGRMTPTPDPSEEDDWSMPGELSPEAALAYFAKNTGFNCHLELCEGEDCGAEFILERREVLRTLSPSGAAQWLQPGELVDCLFVRRGSPTAAAETAQGMSGVLKV